MGWYFLLEKFESGWVCGSRAKYDWVSLEASRRIFYFNFCKGFAWSSGIDVQAHSAPLGLAFIPEQGWPKEYWHDLLVACHGSWNRSTPTGYKIVRFKFDARGNFEGQEDFISGWLENNRALGRPVDILIQPGGVMYISDDKAGVIYKVMYQGEL